MKPLKHYFFVVGIIRNSYRVFDITQNRPTERTKHKQLVLGMEHIKWNCLGILDSRKYFTRRNIKLEE